MKLRTINNRIILDVTKYEASLIKDALYDFALDRSDTQSWDSLSDPILVTQMNKVLADC